MGKSLAEGGLVIYSPTQYIVIRTIEQIRRIIS